MSNGGIIGPVQNPIVSVASSPATTTFTSSGTYTSGPQARFVNYAVVAGGGGSAGGAGGGGAGGLRTCTSFPVTVATPYPITVGAGGAGNNATPAPAFPGSPSGQTGASGSPSIFSTITSAGGGAGVGVNAPSPNGPGFGSGLPGGSG